MMLRMITDFGSYDDGIRSYYGDGKTRSVDDDKGDANNVSGDGEYRWFWCV